MMQPDRFYQVWRAPGGLAHAIVIDPFGKPKAFCRYWWPNQGWFRVDDETRVTCISCCRSRTNLAAIGLKSILNERDPQ